MKKFLLGFLEVIVFFFTLTIVLLSAAATIGIFFLEGFGWGSVALLFFFAELSLVKIFIEQFGYWIEEK